LIFVGDIALGYLEPFEISSLPDEMKEASWVGNFEGPLMDADLNSNVVFNGVDATEKLLKQYNFKCLSLANNHIQDAGVFSAGSTFDKLESTGCSVVGLGKHNTASTYKRIINKNGVEMVILNYGWSVIGCRPHASGGIGCADIDEERILFDIEDVIKSVLGAKIIVYLHWGIELEVAPEPYHRHLAHLMIDAGVELVIGCHAHRFQGAEVYNGKNIIYGIGNWMFARRHFWGGKLDYPECCDTQLAVAYDLETGHVNIHLFEYNRIVESLVYQSECSVSEVNERLGLQSFAGMTDPEYTSYFRAIREKKKLLPVYLVGDGKTIRNLKGNWIKLRHYLLMGSIKGLKILRIK
jgi:poly-gamma-glutamate synthesis protein (capsule biosynthesis protein)